jgi:outer membrane beta-barrel protein
MHFFKEILMKPLLLIIFTSFFIMNTSNNCFAREADNQESVFAIQNRIFFYHHELSLDIGYIPDDEFHYSYPLGLNYTYNFNDNWAWDLRGSYVYNSERDLRQDLLNNYGAIATDFDKLEYIAHSHLLFKPIYGKDSYLNKSVFNHEAYVFIGGGMVSYIREYHDKKSDPETASSLSMGAGIKFFLNEHYCLNFEFRDMINFREKENENHAWFGFSLGYRFNLTPREKKVDPSVNAFGRYILNDQETFL